MSSKDRKHRKFNNFVPCVRCGFVPQDACQMDRDHINGDHSDNRPENIQILCANCHRLKTKEDVEKGIGVNKWHGKGWKKITDAEVDRFISQFRSD